MLDITINLISRRVLLYVLDNSTFNYDFIIGLDLIPRFRLSLDYNLKITQVPINKKKIEDQLEINNVKWNDYLSENLFESKISHLESSNQSVIRKLLKEKFSAFAKNRLDVGNVTKYECRIELINDKYIAKKPYRCSFEDQAEIERQCNELLKAGMITVSSSPFASPVTMQYRKEGLSVPKTKTRMCIDYRDLNKILVPESHPFPLIDEIMVKTRGCSWFSALDINHAFWSILIRKEDRYKSAFITQHGHFEWRSMPFGLKNGPAVFQRILSGIL
jgi:hypothetical protein